MRRVVTGHTHDGKSTIASDTQISPITITPGWEIYSCWNADEPPVFPNDGSVPPSSLRPVVPVGGFNFGIFTVPPHLEGKDGLGFHTTDTIDFGYVISGEVWLELDDGKEVLLRPGDTYVQNGTRHAWRNKGSETCTLVACMIGAKRK